MIKSNVISNDNSKEHVIDNYRFKVMSEFSNDTGDVKQTVADGDIDASTKVVEEEKSNKEEQIEENKAQESLIQSGFVEDLLKKTDEMSSNIIKLQMQIESQESEFNNRLNTELETAKEVFLKEGYEKAKLEFEKELDELKEKYLKSIAKLEDASSSLENFIIKNEKDLANTAIEIAKEVIAKEIKENSSEIAYNLAKELISELKDAQNIELKVNPVDYDFIKSKLISNEHIKITLDDAISKGSVVVLSNMGNIESDLNSRLAKIQKMAL